MTNDELICQVNNLMALLHHRGFGDRDRLFRKLVEEAGEYAEAIEYLHGGRRKIEKFKNKVTAREKLEEEIVDVIMMGLALATLEDLKVENILEKIYNKLTEKENEYQQRQGSTDAQE